MLVDSVYNGKSATEILEETKKYYVKTRELKENKIDLSTPRLFKSPSEEEMELIVSELRKRPSIKYPIPSTALRATQSFCSPLTSGTTFCITASTEQPQRMQSFSTSATSAFQPVIRTPPRPPKSEKIREKLKLQNEPDIVPTSSNNELPPRPIPPPRRSLQKNANIRPIPPPRQQISMTQSYHSPSAFTPIKHSLSPVPISSNLSNAVSTPNLMHQSICCPGFESSFIPLKSQNENLMTSSWYGPLTSNNVQPVRQVPNRIRIPVKPRQLTVTVLGPKNVTNHIYEAKLIKPTPIRSPDIATLKVTRSQSSVTPVTRLNSYHSPGTTSGAGTASGASISASSVANFQIPNKHILSSPTTSKDSGAHDCSNLGSEIEEPQIKQVDKDFEDRIKRWDSCSAPHQHKPPSAVVTTPKQTRPPPIPPKPVFVNDEIQKVNKFFDHCGLATTTVNAALNGKITEGDDAQDISSMDSHFTSITDNKVQSETNEKTPTKDCNESDDAGTERKPPNVATKPVSMIEKNARVIQWIHGCTLASTVC